MSHLRRAAVAASISLLFIASAQAREVGVVSGSGGGDSSLYRSGGPVGVGLTLGHRAGFTFQAWPTPNHAFAVDIGATPFVNTMSMTAGWTGRPLHLMSPAGVSAHFYLGVGMRVRLAFATTEDTNGGDDVTTVTPLLGPRIPIGFSFLLRDFPVEFFAEVAPAVDVWSGFGIDVEGIAGVRVYLPGNKSTRTRSEPPAEVEEPAGPFREKLPRAERGALPVELTVTVRGKSATAAVRLGSILIGKGDEATLQVYDPSLADLHCNIRLLDGNWMIVDLGGPGGTLVNGEVVSSGPLQSGDLIRIGDTDVTFNVGAR